MLNLDNTKSHQALGLTDIQVVEMYRAMLLARRVDDRMWALNRQGRVPFVVSVAGHEASQVGAAFAIDPSRDWSLPYYRDIAYNLALGLTPEEFFLSVFARATDPSSGGRQMPNHWSEPDRNVFTHSSVIATQFPHACGIAFRLKAEGTTGVVTVMSGEGATSEGDWHEAMNFAGIHKLPLIFLIQNNLYAISVPEAQEVAGGVAERAAGYGIRGIEVDGNDILAVYGVMSAAVERARNNEGPTLIEAKTYRLRPHTSDDDDRKYRRPEEVEMWRRRDPIEALRQYLIEARLLSERFEEELNEEVSGIVTAAVEAAEAAPAPSDAMSFVYANPITPTAAVTSIEQVPDGPEVNMITAINRSLHDAMERSKDVRVFGEDVADPKGGVFKATMGLTDEYGVDRAFNAPLAESLIIGIAVGMAGAGGRPIAEIQFADFIHPAFDQIVSEAARIHYRSNGRWTCPLVIRVPYGGGIHGALYHSQSIEAFYAHVPGLKVVVPSTPADVLGLVRSAVADPDPVMILEPKRLYRLSTGPLPEGEWVVPLGKAALRRLGDDVTILAYGTMAHYAVEASDRLAEMGVGARVLDLRSLRPLDWPSIQHAVSHTGKVLIVHEDNEFLGYGAEVAAQIGEKSFDWLDAPIQRYASPEIPTFPYAGGLESQLMPSVDGITERALKLAKY
jgi:2-oxoisovalerate dehydrogenase E1 component